VKILITPDGATLESPTLVRLWQPFTSRTILCPVDATEARIEPLAFL
jgi:hypothetical protein